MRTPCAASWVVALPSKLGAVAIYLSADVGHRRGLMVFTEEASLGVGVRLALDPAREPR